MTRLFVTGLPRSGTSMTCQVLDACGADFGTNLGRSGGSVNPFGFWEDLAMRRDVLKPWLRRLNADPNGQWPLPPRTWRPTGPEADAFRQDVDGALVAPCHKSPKTLPLWRLVHAAFPTAHWLVVRRDPEAIAQSCLRTRFMRHATTREGWLEWIQHMEARIGDLRAEVDVVEVWPDPSNPDAFQGAVEALGYRFDADRVAAVLHPEKWGPP